MKPPYECPFCEAKTVRPVKLKKSLPVVIIGCSNCKLYEIFPKHPSFGVIDFWCYTFDKWVHTIEAYRELYNLSVPHLPTFKFRRMIREDFDFVMKTCTFGSLNVRILYETDGTQSVGVGGKFAGGEHVMPISIEEAMKLPKTRPAGGLVDWVSVVDQINKSKQYYSAKEVTETFCENKVKSFRTKAVLDKAFKEGLLDRYWHQRSYVYGPPQGKAKA